MMLTRPSHAVCLVILYSSINLFSCESLLSRKDQCQLHQKNKVLGRWWKHWEPYYDSDAPCMLFCKVKKITHYANFGPVEDGTPCIPGGHPSHTCVKGVCQQHSCDHSPRSNKKLDDCGICGGRNRKCNHVQEKYDDLGLGNLYEYSHLATIRAGASNIKLIDTSRINFLALSTINPNASINEQWRLSPPGLYEMAGSIAVHEKKYNARDGDAEIITIVGPTRQDILIRLLQQEANPGVSLEYWHYDGIRSSGPGPLVSDTSTPTDEPVTMKPNRKKSIHKVISEFEIRVHELPENIKDGRNMTTIKDQSGTAKANKKYNTRKVIGEYEIRVHKRPENIEDGRNKPKGGRKFTPRHYLIDNRLPPAISNSGLSVRIPVGTGGQEMLQRVEAMEGCGDTLRQMHYVRQEPLLIGNNIDPRQTQPALYRLVPIQGQCPPCDRIKISPEAYCKAAFVARVKPRDKEIIGREARFDVEVMFIYRSAMRLNLISREFIYSPIEDSTSCTCPNLTIGREYLVLGDYEVTDNVLKLTLNKTSYASTYTFNHISQFTEVQTKVTC